MKKILTALLIASPLLFPLSFLCGCAGSRHYSHGTVFKLVDEKTVRLENGEYLTNVHLTPVGKAPVPLLLVDVETRNGAIIKSLTINAEGTCVGKAPETGTHTVSKAKNVHPQQISIRMITDKNPADFQMGITPFIASN